MTRRDVSDRDLSRFFGWVIAGAFAVAFLAGLAVGVSL